MCKAVPEHVMSFRIDFELIGKPMIQTIVIGVNPIVLRIVIDALHGGARRPGTNVTNT
jgi:hypothetical protein